MKRSNAFTLVELLVVIAIIALLLAILMPALNKVRAQARKVVCATRVKQLTTAAILAAQQDVGGKLPRGGQHYGSTDFDSPQQLLIEDYFNMGAAFANIGGGYSTDNPFDLGSSSGIAAADSINQKLDGSGFRKIWACPDLLMKLPLQPATAALPSEGPGPYQVPYIIKTNGSPQRGLVYIGYQYVAGFQMDSWPTPYYGTPYRSPLTLSDKGSGVVVTDRTRWQMGFSTSLFTITHSSKGYYSKALTVDPRTIDPAAGLNFGCLDGSVQYKMLKDCQPRQCTQFNTSYPNNRTGKYLYKEDYAYW